MQDLLIPGLDSKPVGTTEITVVSDSLLPLGGDQDGTLQLPCSPSGILKTDVAMETLRKVDQHDAEMEAEVLGTKALFVVHAWDQTYTP